MHGCEKIACATRDRQDFYELHFLRQCTGIINDIIDERYREIDPHAPAGTPFPKDLEVTSEMLVVMDAQIK